MYQGFQIQYNLLKAKEEKTRTRLAQVKIPPGIRIDKSAGKNKVNIDFHQENAPKRGHMATNLGAANVAIIGHKSRNLLRV